MVPAGSRRAPVANDTRPCRQLTPRRAARSPPAGSNSTRVTLRSIGHASAILHAKDVTPGEPFTEARTLTVTLSHLVEEPPPTRHRRQHRRQPLTPSLREQRARRVKMHFHCCSVVAGRSRRPRHPRPGRWIRLMARWLPLPRRTSPTPEHPQPRSADRRSHPRAGHPVARWRMMHPSRRP